MSERSIATWHFALGARVQWEEAPGTVCQVVWRRWTERVGLEPLIEYSLGPLHGGAPVSWADEAEIRSAQ